jgi:hypothetical protein
VIYSAVVAELCAPFLIAAIIVSQVQGAPQSTGTQISHSRSLTMKGWKFKHAHGAIGCLPWAWTIGAKVGPIFSTGAALGLGSQGSLITGVGGISLGVSPGVCPLVFAIVGELVSWAKVVDVVSVIGVSPGGGKLSSPVPTAGKEALFIVPFPCKELAWLSLDVGLLFGVLLLPAKRILDGVKMHWIDLDLVYRVVCCAPTSQAPVSVGRCSHYRLHPI